MSYDLAPYLVLLFAIIAGLCRQTRTSMVLFAIATALGVATGRLTLLALVPIALLGFLGWVSTRGPKNAILRFLFSGLFLILAVAMSSHLAPGFNNLPIFQGVQFSPDSLPFTMYLNFDKVAVGLFILIFFVNQTQSARFTLDHLITVGRTLGILLVLLIPTALAIDYIRVDAKLPELGWIWMLNNLFFVCVAEEALFRGFIQTKLSAIFPKERVWALIPILIAAVLFGLAHYKGGVAYVGLAAGAGLFYGYAYQKTHRLESAILVHFGLNLVHFLFFSYPALTR